MEWTKPVGRFLPSKTWVDGSMKISERSDHRISLIIPCYNGGRYIKEALDSVLGQSLVPSDILVVDDGSTDDSVRIIERYAPQVRLVRQSNRGDSYARNVALARTTSPLVAFLDADDIWPSGSLERRFEALIASPGHDYVYGLMEQFVSPELASRLTVPASTLAGGIARVLGGSLFRRSIFDDVGGFNPDIRIGYVIEWINKVEAAGYKALAMPDLVLRRRIHDSNSVHDEQRLKKDYLQVIRSSLAHRRSIAP
jgi:glycosyltransferase involved in cell wall biosynthesis